MEKLKSERGALSIEALYVLPLFVCFCLALFQLMDAFAVQMRIQNALTEAAMQISYNSINDASYAESSYVPVFAMQETEKALLKVNPDIDNYLRKHGVMGGLSSIDYSESAIQSGGKLNLRARVNINLLPIPYSSRFLMTRQMNAVASTKLWRR